MPYVHDSFIHRVKEPDLINKILLSLFLRIWKKKSPARRDSSSRFVTAVHEPHGRGSAHGRLVAVRLFSPGTGAQTVPRHRWECDVRLNSLLVFDFVQHQRITERGQNRIRISESVVHNNLKRNRSLSSYRKIRSYKVSSQTIGTQHC
jgi:hypothetical protein